MNFFQAGINFLFASFLCQCYDALMFYSDVLDLGVPDIEIYKCITEEIDTDRVIVSEKQLLHMAEHHPEAYTESPDFAII